MLLIQFKIVFSNKIIIIRIILNIALFSKLSNDNITSLHQNIITSLHFYVIELSNQLNLTNISNPFFAF
jgi:hypothetical protein